MLSLDNLVNFWYVVGYTIARMFHFLWEGVVMALKPKNVEKDSLAYTLPHEVGFLIRALADQEAERLRLTEFSPSDYLERLIKQLAEEQLPADVRAEAKRKHEERKRERLRRAEVRQKKEEAGKEESTIPAS
jgi:hypothetical protein